MKPGTKVKFGNDRHGVIVDWKKYPKFLANRNDFDFRTSCVVKACDGLHVVAKDKLQEVLEGKEIRKITEGTVIQRWDKATGKFLGQEFIAGDLCGYEDEHGNPIESEDDEMIEPEYRTYEMVQDPPTGETFEPPFQGGDDHRPDGPVCSVCGKKCAPSGVDGGSWVHFDHDAVVGAND